MASITCGACKGTHDSVIVVRNCYGKAAAQKAVAAPTTPRWAKENMRSFGANATTRVTRPAVRLATDPQINFIADLMVQPEPAPDARKETFVSSMTVSRDRGHLTFEDASATIDSLKGSLHAKRQREASAPAPSANRNNLPDVPEGRYAIEEDGVLKFFRVDRPTEGRWAGRTFVSIQASDDLHPVKNPDRKYAILAEIARDPKAAMVRYGHNLGKCGMCGRTLTDETSRANGIGPVCAAKF